MAVISPSALTLPLPHETHLWQLHIPRGQPYRDLWFAWLSDDEQARAARFLRDEDRDRFVLSRGGLRYLLSGYLKDEPDAFTFSYNPYGKPALDQSLLDLYFNLAHSGEWIVYGFSRCQWIGVDVEERVERTYLDSLIQRCLTVEEQSTLGCERSSRLLDFLKYWTTKEAHLKALGLGLSYPMDEVQVELQPTPTLKRPGMVENQTIQDWTVEMWFPSPNAIAASCVGQGNVVSIQRSFL